jgi:hypothetical protein
MPLLRKLAGLGIGVFTPIAFMDELRAGQLKFVPFDEPSLGQTEISLIAPHHQKLSMPACRSLGPAAGRVPAADRRGRGARLGDQDSRRSARRWRFTSG